MSLRAEPGTGWVQCPPQDSHRCLSRPETSLQTPLPTGAAPAQLQAQTEHMLSAAAHHGTLHPEHGTEGNQPHGHITGTSNGFVALIPKLQGPSEDPHFTWTEVDPI